MGESSQITLLGFAGHRTVSDPDGLGQAISAELAGLKAVLGDRMTALSSAAAGADLIFLRTCVGLRIPAIVILPFPESRFAEDFGNESEWKLAEQLTGFALAKYVVPGSHPAPEAYRQVSRHLLDWADAFLFAWDGNAPRGAGGTGETVREARELGIPARIIDAASLEARWENPPETDRKPRHGFRTHPDLLDALGARLAEA